MITCTQPDYCLLPQVLVDTEAEGHRVAFNEAFKRKGRPATRGGTPHPVGGGRRTCGDVRVLLPPC